MQYEAILISLMTLADIEYAHEPTYCLLKGCVCDYNNYEILCDWPESIIQVFPKFNQSSYHISDVDNVKSFSITHNHVQNLSVEDLIPLASMKKLNLSYNKINSLLRSSDENFEVKSLENVDLSHNLIQVLHPLIFTSFPSLMHLNLSNNIIHTVASTCFLLPSLSSLNLSNNKISDISTLMMQSLIRLKHLFFSHNSISTLAGGIFSTLKSLEILDLSWNNIMKIENETLVGMNLSLLNLNNNELREVPTTALTKLIKVIKLNLDGNLFGLLYVVSYLSISHCKLLTVLEKDCISNLPTKSLIISHNPKLIYISPLAIKNLPHLKLLNLSHNHIQTLEQSIKNHLPANVHIDLKENTLLCHWTNFWMKKSLTNLSWIEHCPSNQNLWDRSPYILPVLPSKVSLKTGDTASFKCDYIRNESNNSSLIWTTPDNLRLGNNQCEPDLCVIDGILSIPIVTLRNNGLYSCHVTNDHATANISIQVIVKPVRITILPISVTASFITISWNSSQFNKDLLLQIRKLDANNRPIDSSKLVYSSLDIRHSHKSTSFTITDLTASTSYLLELVLLRGQHSVQVSELRLTTQDANYLKDHAITTNYAPAVFIAALVILLICLCLVVFLLRIKKIQTSNLSSSTSNSILATSSTTTSNTNTYSIKSKRFKQNYQYNKIEKDSTSFSQSDLAESTT